MKWIYNTYLLLFFLLLPLTTLNASVKYPSTVTHGGILHIKSNADSITYDGKTYSPLQKSTFLLPIKYRAKIGKHYFTQDKKKYFFQVQKGDYKRDILKVAKDKTNLNKKTQERTIKEALKMKKIYQSNISQQYATPFVYPLSSKLTSLYGNARIFNQQIKSYHSGIDFRAKIGTQIKASNDGVIVLAKDLFYCGKCVIINHGNKIFSIYAHLSGFKVKVGEKVSKGKVIALSGKTGRVTGPHLHFGMVLEGVKIDPRVGIEILNGLM